MLKNKFILIFFLFFIFIVNAEEKEPPFRNYKTFEEWQDRFFKYYYNYHTKIPTDPTFITRTTSEFLSNEYALVNISDGILYNSTGSPIKLSIGAGLQINSMIMSVKTGDLNHQELSGAGTNAHTTIDSFIASKAQPNGLASLDTSSLVVQNPANATDTATANKIPIADSNGRLSDWVIIDTVPASPTEAGNEKELALDSSYLYARIDSTWHRVAWDSWTTKLFMFFDGTHFKFFDGTHFTFFN